MSGSEVGTTVAGMGSGMVSGMGGGFHSTAVGGKVTSQNYISSGTSKVLTTELRSRNEL